MNIRKTTKNDADILAELCLGVQGLHIELQPLIFRQPSQQELADLFRERISDPDYMGFLALDSDKPVGYVVLHIIRKPANVFVLARNIVEIDHIHIIEGYRKQGICKLFAAKTLEVAQSLQIKNVQLSVWAQNDRAIAAFKALGFKNQMHIMSLETSEKREHVIQD
jgi:ribosomal protein S18 acetylase RimI-like enzyme